MVDCYGLRQALAQYSRSGLPSNERTLYSLMVTLIVVSTIDVGLSIALWAMPTRRRKLRAFASALIVCIAATSAAGYFVLSARRDAIALGSYARTRKELVEATRECKFRAPNPKVEYSMRDTRSVTPWRDLIVIFFAGLSGIIATLAAREPTRRMLESTRARENNNTNSEIVEAARRKTIAALRTVESGEEHAVRERTCAVCLEDMSHAALSVLPCAHAFHEQCIAKWLIVAPIAHCPICNTSVASGLARSQRASTAAAERTHTGTEEP